MNTKEIGKLGKDWSPITSIQKEFNRMFDEFFDGFDRTPMLMRREAGIFEPNIDLAENENEFLVTAELPGVDEKDVDISISKNSLIIKGEKKKESEEKNKDYYRKEISYGAFRQVLPLSDEVDESKIEANYHKGILTIKLPKTAKAQQEMKKIPIKAA